MVNTTNQRLDNLVELLKEYMAAVPQQLVKGRTSDHKQLYTVCHQNRTRNNNTYHPARMHRHSRKRNMTVQPGDSIHDAIDNAGAGDAIEVNTGTYIEHVVISKNDISVSGTDADNTVINGGRSGCYCFFEQYK